MAIFNSKPLNYQRVYGGSTQQPAFLQHRSDENPGFPRCNWWTPRFSSWLSRIPHGLSHGFLVNSRHLKPLTSFYMRGMILQVCWNPTKRNWKPEKFVISSTKPWKVRSFSRWTTPFSAVIFQFPKNCVKYTQSISPLMPFKPPSIDDFPSIYIYTSYNI